MMLLDFYGDFYIGIILYITLNCLGVETECASAAETECASAAEPQDVIVVQQQPRKHEEMETQTAVVNVVDVGSQEVLHQVHFTMEVDQTTQEQQVGRKYKHM